MRTYERSSRRSGVRQATTTWFEEPVRIELTLEEILGDLDEASLEWDPAEAPA